MSWAMAAMATPPSEAPMSLWLMACLFSSGPASALRATPMSSPRPPAAPRSTCSRFMIGSHTVSLDLLHVFRRRDPPDRVEPHELDLLRQAVLPGRVADGEVRDTSGRICGGLLELEALEHRGALRAAGAYPPLEVFHVDGARAAVELAGDDRQVDAASVGSDVIPGVAVGVDDVLARGLQDAPLLGIGEPAGPSPGVRGVLDLRCVHGVYLGPLLAVARALFLGSLAGGWIPPGRVPLVIYVGRRSR